MKDSIIVKVSELRSLIQDVRRSGCDIVSLTINESENCDGEIDPAYISFSACKAYVPDLWIDFDFVDAVPNETELQEKSDASPHMSDNLL